MIIKQAEKFDISDCEKSYYVADADTPSARNGNGAFMNNCLCNLLENDYVWLIIIALLLISCCNR